MTEERQLQKVKLSFPKDVVIAVELLIEKKKKIHNVYNQGVCFFFKFIIHSGISSCPPIYVDTKS